MNALKCSIRKRDLSEVMEDGVVKAAICVIVYNYPPKGR